MTDRTLDPGPLPKRAGYPLLVASLPGRDAESLRREMAIAAGAGADLVEVRLDRLAPVELDRLERLHEIPLMHPWLPAIATLRSKEEGGEGPEDRAARRQRYLRALEQVPFSFVDVEIARDAELAEELRSSEGRRLALVASAHLKAVTSVAELEATFQEGRKLGDLTKVVLPATVQRAVDELVPLAARLRGQPFTLHTTGPSGPLLRVLAPRLEMAWLYGRLPPGSGKGTVELSQLPVDRLRRFVDAGPTTRWYTLVGTPLEHTLSPDLHDAFFERTGTGGIYIPLELAREEEFASVLPKLVPLGLGGVNVTRPYKRAAYSLASRHSESAATSGAVNTLVPLASSPPAAPSDGAFIGHNTDVDALATWWGELEEAGAWSGDRVLVVGTGGAARAAITASAEHGALVALVGRRPEAAQALAADFPAEVVRTVDASSLSPFPLVVHTTPVGQRADTHLEIPLEKALAPGSLLVDLVYRPVSPELARIARRAGASYVDGLRMLVYQAARSFEIFTGHRPSRATLDAWLAPSGPGALA